MGWTKPTTHSLSPKRIQVSFGKPSTPQRVPHPMAFVAFVAFRFTRPGSQVGNSSLEMGLGSSYITATGLVVLQTWLPKVLQFQFDQVEPPSKVGNGFGHDTRPQNKANREKGLSSLGWIMQDGWASSCLLVSSLSNHQTTGH